MPRFKKVKRGRLGTDGGDFDFAFRSGVWGSIMVCVPALRVDEMDVDIRTLVIERPVD